MQENLRRTGLTVLKRPVHGQTNPMVHGHKRRKSNHLVEINLVNQREIGPLLNLLVFLTKGYNKVQISLNLHFFVKVFIVVLVFSML